MMAGIFGLVFLIALVATVFSFIGIAVPFGPFSSRGHAGKLAGMSFCALLAGFVGVGVTHVPSTVAHEATPVEQVASVIEAEAVIAAQVAPQIAVVEAEAHVMPGHPTVRRAGIPSGSASVTPRRIGADAPTSTRASSPDLPPRYSVERHCREVASVSGGSAMIYNGCIDMEQASYNSASRKWISIPTTTRRYCDEVARVTGGSYMILDGCLDMERSAIRSPSRFRH